MGSETSPCRCSALYFGWSIVPALIKTEPYDYSDGNLIQPPTPSVQIPGKQCIGCVPSVPGWSSSVSSPSSRSLPSISDTLFLFLTSAGLTESENAPYPLIPLSLPARWTAILKMLGLKARMVSPAKMASFLRKHNFLTPADELRPLQRFILVILSNASTTNHGVGNPP